MVESILASGYSPHSLMDILNKFNFEKIKGDDIVKNSYDIRICRFIQNQRVLNKERKNFFIYGKIKRGL